MKPNAARSWALGFAMAVMAGAAGWYWWKAKVVTLELTASIKNDLYSQIAGYTPLTGVRYDDIQVDQVKLVITGPNDGRYEARVRVNRRPFAACSIVRDRTLVPTGIYETKVSGTCVALPVYLVPGVPALSRQTWNLWTSELAPTEARMWPANLAPPLWASSEGREENALFDAWLNVTMWEDWKMSGDDSISALLAVRHLRRKGDFEGAKGILDQYEYREGYLEAWKPIADRERKLTASKSREPGITAGPTTFVKLPEEPADPLQRVRVVER